MQTREIENRLMECPDVREVCVLSHVVPAGTARYHAFVVLSKNTPAVREYFQAHCKVRLKEASLAMDLQVMDRLPRTAVGAVSRRALAALAQANACS